MSSPCRFLFLGTLALLAALLPASCGYTTRLEAEDGLQTIGLEVFLNDSDLRDLEAPLYEELSEAILERVRMPLVAPNQADLVVRGRILEYQRRAGIRSDENRLLETGVRLRVESWAVDTRSNEIISSPPPTTVDVGYVVGQGRFDLSTDDTTVRNRPLELRNEREARDRALRNLSERLILDLFAGMN